MRSRKALCHTHGEYYVVERGHCPKCAAEFESMSQRVAHDHISRQDGLAHDGKPIYVPRMPRKWFISHSWSRKYGGDGAYHVDHGYGNAYRTHRDGSPLSEEDIRKLEADLRIEYLPAGSKLVDEITTGAGVKITIVTLNIVEIESW